MLVESQLHIVHLWGADLLYPGSAQDKFVGWFRAVPSDGRLDVSNTTR